MRAFLLSLLLATTAHAATRVLIIWDVKNAQTTSLAESLKTSGAEVTFSDTAGPGFTGDNPPLSKFDVVVHLNGTTFAEDMPESGQRALVRFVENGGGYLHHEWNAYGLSIGHLRFLRPLILFDRDSGYSGDIVIKKVAGPKIHPVIWEVPGTFTMKGGCNIGHIHKFEEEPSMVLARDQNGNDAIAVREFAFGRIVGFHHGGNWGGDALLASGDARRLFVDGVRWAYGCDPQFREGRRDKLCAKIAERRAKN
jgi:hypothetical protein